jgi:hypothetical protein
MSTPIICWYPVRINLIISGECDSMEAKAGIIAKGILSFWGLKGKIFIILGDFDECLRV